MWMAVKFYYDERECHCSVVELDVGKLYDWVLRKCDLDLRSFLNNFGEMVNFCCNVDLCG